MFKKPEVAFNVPGGIKDPVKTLISPDWNFPADLSSFFWTTSTNLNKNSFKGNGLLQEEIICDMYRPSVPNGQSFGIDGIQRNILDRNKRKFNVVSKEFN